jgi:hypothetical protein
MSSGRRPRVHAAVVAGGRLQFDPVTLEIAWSRLQTVIDEGETHPNADGGEIVRSEGAPIWT